jgi:hypothetical protein
MIFTPRFGKQPLAQCGNSGAEWNNPFDQMGLANSEDEGDNTPLQLTLDDPPTVGYAPSASTTPTTCASRYEGKEEVEATPGAKYVDSSVFRLADALSNSDTLRPNRAFEASNQPRQTGTGDAIESKLEDAVEGKLDADSSLGEHMRHDDSATGPLPISPPDRRSCTSHKSPTPHQQQQQATAPRHHFDPSPSQVSTGRSSGFQSSCSAVPTKYFLCFTCYARRDEGLAVRSEEGDQLFCSEACNVKHEQALADQRERVRSAIQRRVKVDHQHTSATVTPR